MKFDDLKILGDALIDGETDEGPHDLCPISACRTGIDIKGIKSGIVLDHEDVRVTGDKDLGSLCPQAGRDAERILTGTSDDVTNEYFRTLDLENLLGRALSSQHSPINVAVDGTHRTYLTETLKDREVADISGMPDLITLGKVVCVSIVPSPVGVGEHAYTFHGRCLRARTSSLKTRPRCS